MITVRFFKENRGFSVSGHSGYAQEGSDIICAGISSAAYMTANTLTEIIGAKTDIDVRDGFMELRLHETTKETDVIMEGFRLHISQFAAQYPEYVIQKD